MRVGTEPTALGLVLGLERDALPGASFWGVLRDLCERGVSRDEGLPVLRAAVERDFSG